MRAVKELRLSGDIHLCVMWIKANSNFPRPHVLYVMHDVNFATSQVCEGRDRPSLYICVMHVNCQYCQCID